MNKKIFFALILYAALNAAENNHAPCTFLPLPNCTEVAWLKNGIVLVNAQCADQDDIWQRRIVSIDINNPAAQKDIVTFDSKEGYYTSFITLTQDKTSAFIGLPNSSILFKNNNDFQEKDILKTEWRPAFEENGNIILIPLAPDNKVTIYDGSNTLKPDIKLDQVIAKINEDKSSLDIFNNEIVKHPNKDIYALSAASGLALWMRSTDTLSMFPLRDTPICVKEINFEPPLSCDDTQYNSRGSHIAFTGVTEKYVCWIFDTQTKQTLTLKKKNENTQEIEKYKQEFIKNDTVENRNRFITAVRKSQYPIYTKAFHPLFAHILATLGRSKLSRYVVKYWNIHTGTAINKYTLAYDAPEIVSCVNHLLAFSPDGNRITCALHQGLVILDISTQEISDKLALNLLSELKTY